MVVNAIQNSRRSKIVTRATEKVVGPPETIHLTGNFFFNTSTLS